MPSLFNLPTCTLTAILALTACTGANVPDVTYSEPAPLDAQANGVWYSSEKDWVLEINDGAVTRWEYSPEYCYRTPEANEATPMMGQVEYRLYRAASDGQAVRLQYLPGDASAYFERMDALPAHCGSEDLTSETVLFDIFANTMAEHYGFFEPRGVDWYASVEAARARVRDGMGEAALWQVFSDLLLPLGDSHTKMIGMVDGERARIQGGMGTTLPMIGVGIGEGAWVMGLVNQLETDVLDEGMELIADRVVVGEIDGRVGYIQIFTMGGFSSGEVPGTIEWSQAELSALADIMDDTLTRFADHEAIIFDLSNNRGGYDAVTRALAARFTDDPFLGYRVTVEGEPEATTEYPIEPYDGPRFTGPVYLMTSDVTVSGGEITTMMMKQLPNVTHVGTTTRGAFSTPLAKPLPNGWYLELANETFQTADGVVYEGRGIPPDVEINIYPEDAPIAGHAAAIAQIMEMIDAG